MSFRLKTVLGIALIELSVMAILILVNQYNLGGTAQGQLFERARTTANLFATMVSDAVISFDLATLDSLVDNNLTNESLIYLRVRSADGTELSADGDPTALEQPFVADATFSDALTDHRIDLSAPILIDGQAFGSVELGITTRSVEQETATALQWNIAVAAVGMSLVAIFGFALGSFLTRQLGSLRHGANLIARGNLDHRIPIRGRDELAETAIRFNSMAEVLSNDRADLESQRQTLMDKAARVETIVACMKEIAQGAQSVEVPETERPDEIGDMARATEVFHTAMRAVQKSRAEQARLIQAFDQLDEQVAIFDKRGKAMFLNMAFRQANDDILAKLPPDFTYPAFVDTGLAIGAFPDATGHDADWLPSLLQEQSGDGGQTELRRHPDRVLLVRQRTVLGIGTVITAADITDLKASQAQLVQASKLATLGEMATGMAHELNQPLGVIRMASSNCIKRIAKGSLDGDYLTGKLTRIGEQTERAAKIIDHMRVFGRKADEANAAFEVVASLQNALDLMRKQISVVGITLNENLPADEIWCTGHQITFEQVILNLLGNAKDQIEAHMAASGASSGSITATVVPGPDDGTIRISIADTGGGVPEEIMDRLFDPFFTTKEPGKGTGLGLSISYGIINEMNGTIAAVNANGGADFRIDLPIAVLEARAEAV